jgi:hypothetical protein
VLIEIGIAIAIEIGPIGENLANDPAPDPDFDSDLDDETEGEVRLPWRLILSGVLAAVLGAMPCWVSAIYRQSVARASWHV